MAEFKKVKEEVEDKIRALSGSTKDIRKYTHQIWLAGLGAFSKSDDDGEGGKLFEKLVEAGREIEAKTREQTQSRVKDMTDKVKERTGETMEKMERAFDDRLTGALSRLGIPSKKDVDDLNSRIEQLTDALNSTDEKE